MEKSEIATESRSMKDVDGEGAESVDDTEALHWQPGYAERFPIIGVASLCFVLLATVSSAAVLIGSNNVSSTRWPKLIAPNVCLQILNALSNIMLAAAIAQGIAIAWWRKASKGATVADLHRSWEFSTGIRKIAIRVWAFDSVALAALAAYFAIIHGTLFQRAAGTYISQAPATIVPVVAAAATEFPKTGFVVSNQTFGAQAQCGCFMIGDAYSPVVNVWQTSNGFFSGYNDWFRTAKKKSLLDKVEQQSIRKQHCDGTCYADVEAIGFEIDCTTNNGHENIAAAPIAAYEAAGNGTSGDSSAWSNIPIFNSSFLMVYPETTSETAYIEMKLHYFQSDDPNNAQDASCPGRVVDTTCRLHPALVSYPVKVMNYTNAHIVNGVSLGLMASASESNDAQAIYDFNSTIPVKNVMKYDPTQKQAEGFGVVQRLNVSDSHQIGASTALGGIANALHLALSSSATISYTPEMRSTDASWSLDQQGTFAQTMMYGPPNMGSCDCSFRSEALDIVIQSINQLMFLTSIGMIDHDNFQYKTVKAGEEVTIRGVGTDSTASFRTLPNTKQIRDVVFYTSNYTYMGLAIASAIICILLVVPSFWRYGELGRNVTLGPIEVANAFHAPLLTEGRQHAKERGGDIKALIDEVGHKQVQYGFVEEVSAPSPGLSGRMQRTKSVRLEIAEPTRVRPVSTAWTSPPNSPRSPDSGSRRFPRFGSPRIPQVGSTPASSRPAS